MDTSEYLGLFLDESRESLEALGASLLALERDPADREALGAIFRVAHSLKGMSAAMGFAAMAALTHRMEEVLAAARDHGALVTPAVGDALFACLDALREMVDRVAAGDPVEVDASAVTARLDAIAAAAAGATRTAATSAPAAAAPRPAGSGRRPATVRVGTDRLDALMDLIGELEDHGRRGAPAELARVAADLRALAVQMRMMPVDAVFTRFPRMVRDLAMALGKRVALVVEGGGTVVDRAIVDGLGEPLMHMLRNAVDHGLEAPGERIAAGKDPAGTIRLSARLAGGEVLVEVCDDGRGMDPAALRASAIAKGLIDPAGARALSDAQALRLVLLPGFSTVAEASDVSGRGVGMDAVRAAIGGLGGEVAIASAAGAGTRFTIRLPARTSTHDVGGL